MAKIKYTATDANGLVHTRSSARVYTHMVVARPSYANAIAKANAPWMPTAKSNFKFYSDIVAGREDTKYTTLARATEELGGAATVDEYAAILIARGLAAVEKSKADGRFDRFIDMGWCGRPDLAEKLAAKTRGEGYAEVAILPAK